ncbi:MAG: AIPR family protein [Leptolyngbyaceae cyanobacterium]
MANLTSFGVLQQLVKTTQDTLSLGHAGEAFDYVSLELILKLNEDDIENSLTDGPSDGGIDAIYIDGRNVHICNFKYTYDFEKTKKNFPGTEIDKLISTLLAFISGSLSREIVNELVFEKYSEIRTLLHSGPLYFHLHLASNKGYPVEGARKKLEQSLSQFRYIKFSYYNLEDLVEIVLQNQIKKVDGQLTLLDKDHFEKSDANIRTIIGVIAAQDLVELVRDSSDSNKINQFIFDENIRTYRPKHSINKGIIESALSEENYQFFYLNNGITILCEKADYQPNIRNPRVPLKNVQIINGGQTSHSLFEAYKKSPEKVADIDLLVRICEVGPDDYQIKSKISETTNKQIPVATRDLHSNDLIQRKLEVDFEKKGYFYESKPGRHKDKPKDKVLNNELLGQLYMAYHLDRPSAAKNSKRIFGNT